MVRGQKLPTSKAYVSLNLLIKDIAFDDPPSAVEISADGIKLRCKLCIEYSTVDYPGLWIQTASYWHHQKSLIHTQSKEQKRTAEIHAAALQAERVQEEQ
jgi:hypothetical protein